MVVLVWLLLVLWVCKEIGSAVTRRSVLRLLMWCYEVLSEVHGVLRRCVARVGELLE